MAYITDTFTTGFNLFERIAAFRATALERAARTRLFRQTFNELSAMTNRELADIGVNRGMIRSIAMEAAFGTK